MPHPLHRLNTSATRGFTLVELVVTIIVAGILAVGVTQFIGNSAQGLVVARNQNQLAAGGQAVIERLAVELYNSVPNSIRIDPVGSGDQCLEFLPFTHATVYVNAPFSSADDVVDVVVSNPAAVAFPSGAQTDRYAVLYPIVTDELYESASSGPIAEVSDIDSVPGNADLSRLTLDADHVFPRRSPLERLFLSGQPVSFCVEGAKLYRYSGYGFHETQCEPGSCLASGEKALVADNLGNASLTAFAFLPGTLQRNGIVQFNFNFREGGSELTLRHELLLRNVP